MKGGGRGEKPMVPEAGFASYYGHPVLKEKGWAVGVRNSPKPPPERVTLTLPAIQGARSVLILATGAGKAEAVQRAKRGEVPSGMIAGARWLIDRAASGE